MHSKLEKVTISAALPLETHVPTAVLSFNHETARQTRNASEYEISTDNAGNARLGYWWFGKFSRNAFQRASNGPIFLRVEWSELQKIWGDFRHVAPLGNEGDLWLWLVSQIEDKFRTISPPVNLGEELAKSLSQFLVPDLGPNQGHSQRGAWVHVPQST